MVAQWLPPDWPWINSDMAAAASSAAEDSERAASPPSTRHATEADDNEDRPDKADQHMYDAGADEVDDPRSMEDERVSGPLLSCLNRGGDDYWCQRSMGPASGGTGRPVFQQVATALYILGSAGASFEIWNSLSESWCSSSPETSVFASLLVPFAIPCLPAAFPSASAPRFSPGSQLEAGRLQSGSPPRSFVAYSLVPPSHSYWPREAF
ncbi:hypothetical protein V8E54_013150 [Elaphomyces granulatus]